MQRIFPRFSFVLFIVLGFTATSFAQDTTATSVDPALQGIESSRPQEYTIQQVTVTGAQYLDTAIILSISGLQAGDVVQIPGTDAFSKAIANLWRQRLFSNVQIFITNLTETGIWLEINVQERPRLSSYKFIGARKTEVEDIQGKITLSKSTIITENTRRNAIEAITKYYAEKGYMNATVHVEEKPDPALTNSNIIIFHINKGQKVKINEVAFFGNDEVTDLKLKKNMKETKEMTKISLFPEETAGPFGVNQKMPLSEYLKDYGFLSFSKTKAFLDPYARIKLFSSSKFDRKKFEEDLEQVLNHYNALGYRDAQIVDTAFYFTPQGNLNVDIKIDEGRKYYFGNITLRGNTKYSDSLLNAIINIRKGDIYNIDVLNKSLGKQLSPEGGDISGLYMDDGYLFFRAEPVETAVYNDTIDHEIRIVEGPQATIRSVNIYGNDKTKDYVVRRELRTLPGEKFSRSDLIRSQRELAQLQYFNQEKINPGVNPNQEDGTVDINWNLEEKSSDQLELSAGWGGGVGLTGTLGITFNNFSIRNITKKESWSPLPSGDGQKLSMRIQSNGKAYQSYNFSFTEPWLGGKKRNSLTFAMYHSAFRTGNYNAARQRYEYSDTTSLKTTGASISLGKQLKWPDDYFSLLYSLNYTQYKLKNYPNFFRLTDGTDLRDGTSNNVSLKLGLQRSSVYDPTFPRSGSNMIASVQFTPPYSSLNPDLVTSKNPYKNPEYHKWRFSSEWFVPIGKAMGAEKNRQFVMKLAAKYGFMGRYNRKLDFSPFERFQVGGDGLTNSYGVFGYDVIALRGYPVFETSNPSQNPDLSQASQYFTIFNKYSLELRYPLVINPSSTIYALTFFDAANGWFSFKDYNPFRLRRSVGAGMRFFLPMFGMLGFDYGIGLDRMNPQQRGLKSTTKFTFMLGFEPE